MKKKCLGDLQEVAALNEYTGTNYVNMTKKTKYLFLDAEKPLQSKLKCSFFHLLAQMLCQRNQICGYQSKLLLPLLS